MPRADRPPALLLHERSVPSPSNPLGAKGAGKRNYRRHPASPTQSRGTAPPTIGGHAVHAAPPLGGDHARAVKSPVPVNAGVIIHAREWHQRLRRAPRARLLHSSAHSPRQSSKYPEKPSFVFGKGPKMRSVITGALA
jgi:hypothetical protein